MLVRLLKGEILRAETWTLITFFNINANATKLGDFFLKSSGNNFMTFHCPLDLMFPWQPYFGKHVFSQNFNFSYFKIKQ